MLQLYREKYFDFNVQHFHEKLVEEHGIRFSYTWVKTALQEAGMEPAATSDDAAIETARGWVRGRGANQVEYVAHIRHHDLVFGIGPAGTGKTYLAVACAVEALNRDRVLTVLASAAAATFATADRLAGLSDQGLHATPPTVITTAAAANGAK